MERNRIIDEYFEWLANIVTPKCSGVSYRKLLMHLHRTPFKYYFTSDSDRAHDGECLRWRFAQDTERARFFDEISDYLAGPCSVLELMIGIAVRCEETIMDDPRYGDRTAQWFWRMVNNLGLSAMYDSAYDKKLVNIVIEKFMAREYSRNGSGGLFAIQNCSEDLRNMPIWSQFCWYIDSFS